MTAIRHDHGHHGIPNLDTCTDTFANLIDDARRIHTRHVGWRVDLLLLGPGTVSGHGIGGIDRCGMHMDAHLPWSGLNLRHLDDLQNLRSTMN
jgi:hypothetical protein